MADELSDLLKALDQPSSAKPGPCALKRIAHTARTTGPIPAGLTVGKAVFSDGRPVPKHGALPCIEPLGPSNRLNHLPFVQP